MTKSVMSPRARHGARRNEASVTSGARSVALAVLLELVAELPGTDTEQLGGAGLDPTGTRQSHLEVPVRRERLGFEDVPDRERIRAHSLSRICRAPPRSSGRGGRPGAGCPPVAPEGAARG